MHFSFVSARRLPRQEEIATGPHAGKTPGHQGGTATANAPANPRYREMADAGRRESFTRGQATASPSNTQGGSRVPELGSLGSMRGAPRNERLYREQLSRSSVLELRLATRGWASAARLAAIPAGESEDN